MDSKTGDASPRDANSKHPVNPYALVYLKFDQCSGSHAPDYIRHTHLLQVIAHERFNDH